MTCIICGRPESEGCADPETCEMLAWDQHVDEEVESGRFCEEYGHSVDILAMKCRMCNAHVGATP